MWTGRYVIGDSGAIPTNVIENEARLRVHSDENKPRVVIANIAYFDILDDVSVSCVEWTMGNIQPSRGRVRLKSSDKLREYVGSLRAMLRESDQHSRNLGNGRL